MAIKRRPIQHKKVKVKRKRALDAEDKVSVLEKKAAKKQKKFEYSATIQEARKKREAIKAAGTITMEDVVRAVSGKPKHSEAARTANIPDVSSYLASIGVGRKVDDFAWSSESEAHDSSSDEEEDEDNDYSSGEGAEDIDADGSEVEDVVESDVDDEESASDDASAESEEDEEKVDDNEESTVHDQLHKRITFPASSEFTSESQSLFAALMGGKDALVCTETFHENRIARSCYLTLSAFALSHILHKSTQVERNNRNLRKKGEGFEIPLDSRFRDQGPNRPRICMLAPFRANANELIRNWIQLLNLTPEDIGNYENFNAEYEGQELRNEHSKNWELWRRELFKGHYDDATYDDFVIGISFIHGKMRIQFPKTSAALCGVDVIIASPIALSKIAASDLRAIRIRDKAKENSRSVDKDEEELMFEADKKADAEEEAVDLPIMDFMSSIELLIVDRVDALTMQNFDNCRDVVSAVNEKPVASITADINRIESKFLTSETARAARQTVLVAGSLVMAEYDSMVRPGQVERIGDATYSGNSLARSLKQKIKQQFFIRIPIKTPEERTEALMDYFKSKFWKEIGNEIKNLVIVVADTADLAPITEFFDDEGITDCFMSEQSLSDIGGKRRKQIKSMLKSFREGDIRTLVVTERLLWYQRIRIAGAKHVLFFGCPQVDSVYADILADVVDPYRCTSTCLYTASERLAVERVAGTKNLPKLITHGAQLGEMSGKTTVFTPS